MKQRKSKARKTAQPKQKPSTTLERMRSQGLELICNRAVRTLRKPLGTAGRPLTRSQAQRKASELTRSVTRKYRIPVGTDEYNFVAEVLREKANERVNIF